jgi:hypothetical protein
MKEILSILEKNFNTLVEALNKIHKKEEELSIQNERFSEVQSETKNIQSD